MASNKRDNENSGILRDWQGKQELVLVDVGMIGEYKTTIDMAGYIWAIDSFGISLTTTINDELTVIPWHAIRSIRGSRKAAGVPGVKLESAAGGRDVRE